MSASNRLLLICCLFGWCSAALQFDENVHIAMDSGTDCFLEIAKQSFGLHSNLAMVKSKDQYVTTLSLAISTEDLILHKLIKTVSWSMMTKFIGAGSRPILEFGFEKVHNYVIVFQNVMDLDRALRELSGQKSWNSHGMFMCYFAGYPDDFDGIMTAVVEVFWKFWVINLLVMVPIRAINGHVLVTYFPFHGNDCGRAKATYSVIGTCLNRTIDPVALQPFPDKIPNDLNGCLVRVGAVESPPFVIRNDNSSSFSLDAGIEVNLIKTLAEAANFEVQLSMSYITQDNTSSGLLKELAEKNIEIAIGSISPTIEEHRRFDFSVQYAEYSSTWVVPSDQILPQWLSILLVFQPVVYLVVALLLIFLWFSVSRVVKYCALNFRWEHDCYKNSSTFFFIAVGILMANEPPHFPRTKFMKSILAMWTLFCFFFNSAFSATLMSVITSTIFEGGIGTEQQLMEEGLKLMATNRTMAYLELLKGSHEITLEMCPVVELCLGNISVNRDSALAMSRNHFDFIKKAFRDENGNYQLKTLAMNIVTVPLEMLLSKGNPLMSRINQMLLKIKESGLISHWSEKITSRQSALEAKMSVRSEKVLTLNNLRGAFLLWAIGIAASLVAFVGEILRHKIKMG